MSIIFANAQWFRSGRFQLYDYGSASKNTRAYGQSCPPDVASDYALINIPVSAAHMLVVQFSCRPNCLSSRLLSLPGLS